MIRHKYYSLAAAVPLIAVGFVGSLRAATTNVNTTLDDATSYLVSDPDVGDYTVTITGQSMKSGPHDTRWYFRTTETGGAGFMETWNISVTGLDPGEVITALNLNTTRIVPSVGSGSGWSWDIDFSAPLAGGGTFVDQLDLDNDVTVTPDIRFESPVEGQHFGENPTFTVMLERNNSVARSLGWYDFDITAGLAANQVTPGDTTGDGMVTLDDLTPILQNYRTAQTGRMAGDLVDNDFIDFADFRQWKNEYLTAGGSLEGVNLSFLNAPVPEPGSFALVGMALCGLAAVLRRNRK